MDGVIRNGMLELLTAERINTEFDLNKILNNELKTAERINNKFDLIKISNDEQLKEECFPEITKY